MLAVKVIICVLTFVALFIARVKYETECWKSFLVSCVAGILGISFSVKLITMNVTYLLFLKYLCFLPCVFAS